MSAPALIGLSPDHLRRRFKEVGVPAYRADQVAEWVYQRGVLEPEAMTNLPQELRAQLLEDWSFRALEPVREAHSTDGTVKAVLRAADGALVEADAGLGLGGDFVEGAGEATPGEIPQTMNPYPCFHQSSHQSGN